MKKPLPKLIDRGFRDHIYWINVFYDKLTACAHIAVGLLLAISSSE